MKVTFPKHALHLVLFICAAALTGCNSAGYHKGDAAAVSMQSAAAEVQVESQALDRTISAAKVLVTEPEADLRRQFQHYSRSLDWLIACAQRTDNTGRKMAEKNRTYLQAWEKELGQIQFDHIRDLSQSRRTEVSGRFEAVNKRYQESQAVVQPMVRYLDDIRRALSSDLTAGGLEAMKAIVQNAETNSAKVQTALEALVTELNNSSTAMASVAPQSAPDGMAALKQ